MFDREEYIEIRMIPPLGRRPPTRIIDITDFPTRRRRWLYFSNIELKQLTISILVLTFAFAIANTNYNFRLLPVLLPISFLAVFTGFFLHELGHKYIAQKFGCWAEYRYFIWGLIIAIITSLFGVVFAAPGAVLISGFVSREETGKISLAGPAVNLSIAFLMLPIAVGLAHTGPNLVKFIVHLVGMFNAILALFNLIPFPPLDGSKILSWHTHIYIFTIVFAGVLVATYLLI